MCSLTKKAHHDPKSDGHEGGRKSVGVASTIATNSRRKGRHGDAVLDVLQSLTSPSSSIVQVGTFPKFLDQWRSITTIGLCLIW